MPTRRDALWMAGFAGLGQAALPARAADGPARLRTPVCALLGIEHPILQAPMQFIATPDFGGPEGRLAHLGVMCEDLEAALAAARKFDVEAMPQGSNWLRLPDGLAVELIQARNDAVARALAIDARS